MTQRQAQSDLRRRLMRLIACLAGLGAVCAGLGERVLAQPVVQVLAGADQMLLQYLTTTQSLQAQFLHEQISGSGRLMRFSGVMSLQRPGRFRWEVQKPYAQLQLVRDGEFILYDADLAQVTIRPLEEAAMATPAGLLLAAGPDAAEVLQRHFVLRNLEDQDGLSWVLVESKAGQDGGQKLAAGFDAKGMLQQFQLIDQIGRRSRVVLSRIQRNQPLAADLFGFRPPKGVEVIRP
ncbi:MAG: outer membrane lipoprotein chaperone LolA [Betaproteobacteria bacterium]|nr:outer membrane lipoprotein chaperone LolA [Betaproteobacteria bacterium]